MKIKIKEGVIIIKQYYKIIKYLKPTKILLKYKSFKYTEKKVTWKFLVTWR